MSGVTRQPEPTTEWRARERLYVHATLFVLVNATLILIDSLTPSGWWFFWPLLAWAAVLAAHTLRVFGNRRQERS